MPSTNLNEKVYPVKDSFFAVGVITASTTVNTNLDASGSLNTIKTLDSVPQDFIQTNKYQIRQIRGVLTANTTTATVVRLFMTAVETGFNTSNTAYLGIDILFPVTTFAVTTEYSPVIKTYEPGELVIPAGYRILYAIGATFTGGARIEILGDTFGV